ncbi:MAG: hypothetical protein ACI9R3_001268 [Verrucomicrobiales bacterium]|jgi:hypothetical protein
MKTLPKISPCRILRYNDRSAAALSLVTVTVLALSGLVTVADAGDERHRERKRTVPLKLLPPTVAATLAELPSGIELHDAERYGANNDSYKFSGSIDGHDVDVRVSGSGTLLEIDYESRRHRGETVPVETTPDQVLTAILSSYPNFSIEEVVVTEIKGTDLYEIDGQLEKTRVRFYVSGAGHLIGQGADTDGDGLPDSREETFGSHPLIADTDGDMFPDGFETRNGTDPRDSKASPQILTIDFKHNDTEQSDSVVLNISTFYGSVFSVEHCPDARDWTSLDIEITGDDLSHEVVIPIDDMSDCGYFRVHIGDFTTVKDSPIGGGFGTSSSIFTPSSLEGTSFDLDFNGEENKTLQFDSSGQGVMIEREGRRIEVEPFNYLYRRTGNATASITVRYPRHGEDVVVEYKLSFDADGKGSIERSSSKIHDDGSFRYRKR